MKKSLLLGAMLALYAAPTDAQIAYIPDNVTCQGSGLAIPFGPIARGSGRYQRILPAASLPNQPVRVVSVGFASAGGTAFEANQLQIRMGHSTNAATPSTIFAQNFVGCPVVLEDVASGGYTYNAAANTWSDMSSSCDFGYDGQRDLCLEVRFRGKSTTLFGMILCAGGGGSECSQFNPFADNYAAPFGSVARAGGVKTRVTYSPNNVLIAPDQISLGQNGSINLYGMPAGATYAIAASLGQSPQQLGQYTLCLDPDALFFISAAANGGLFQNYSGQADNAGRATATLTVPSISQLAGVCVYHAGIAFGAGGDATNTSATLLAP